MDNLNYTLISESVLSNYVANVYDKPSADFYFLIEKNLLTVDETLWYQSWQGFLFLNQLSNQNITLAAEIQRFVFKDILKGKEIQTDNGIIFQTPDGETFFLFD